MRSAKKESREAYDTMLTPYRAKIAIELMEAFFEHTCAFDALMHRYFRRNKSIGSNDRRAIAEFCYAIFRDYERVRVFLQKIQHAHGRFAVIIFLALQQADLRSIFASNKYAPPALSEFEEALAQKISNYARQELSLAPHIKNNYPEWFEQEVTWTHEDLAEHMHAFNQKAQVHLRINSLKTDAEFVQATLLAEGIVFEKYSDTALIIEDTRLKQNHPLIRDGLVFIQDVGSQRIAELCAPSPGDTVIDYCAGAGGKSLSLAMIMQNKGRIFSLDTSELRLLRARERMAQLGIHNCTCVVIEQKWLKRHAQCANVVLVDAPCSCSGTLRRNPELRAKLKQETVLQMPDLQSQILHKACNLTKDRLVYATCSIFKKENDAVIDRFLDQHPEFVCDSREQMSPLTHKSDGFFVACMRRK